MSEMSRARPNEPPPIVRLMMSAVQLHQQGRFDDAERMYKRALEVEPNNPDALHLLGLIEHKRGRNDEALGLIERAIQAKPREPTFHTNLGQVLRSLNRPADAVAAQRRAIELDPRLAEAHSNLACALYDLKQFDEAEAAARRAIQLNPQSHAAYLNLGNALRERDDFDGAMQAYQQSLRLGRPPEEPLVNIGDMLRSIGRYDESRAVLEEVLRNAPESILAHRTLALVLLLHGEFARGWAEAEWRLRAPKSSGSRFVQPMWDGRGLNGQTVLLHFEQGLGDTIHFARYAPLVAARGGRVILEVQPGLARLMRTLNGVDQVVARGEPLPSFDVHAPLLSLPHLFQTTPDTIPRDVPYLRADDSLVESWRSRVPIEPGVKRVGLVWAGNPEHVNDRRRSLDPMHLARLARVANVRWFSLQLGQPARGATPPPELNMIDLTANVTDFADSAALLAHLDLLITIDSAPAHLAGALGRPVWVLLPHVPDWRWQLGRDDSVWYPTMRLFRQTRPGEWGEVIERVADAVAAWA